MENRLRYGMRVSTIKYWQNQAESLWLHNGIKVIGCLADMHGMSARHIAYAAIGAAHVRNAEQMRALLAGKV